MVFFFSRSSAQLWVTVGRHSQSFDCVTVGFFIQRMRHCNSRRRRSLGAYSVNFWSSTSAALSRTLRQFYLHAHIWLLTVGASCSSVCCRSC